MSNWRFNIGDVVSILCVTVDGIPQLILPAEKNNWADAQVHTFPVIGRCQRNGHLVLWINKDDFDPHRYLVERVNEYYTSIYDVDTKYNNEKCLVVSPDAIYVPADHKKIVQQIHMAVPGGCNCVICGHWRDWANSNLPDGAFACHSCQTTKGWKIREYLKGIGVDPNSFSFN